MSSTSSGITFRFDEGTVSFPPALGDTAGQAVKEDIHALLSYLKNEYYEKHNGKHVCSLEVSRAISNTLEHSVMVSEKSEEARKEIFESLMNPGLKKVIQEIEGLIEQAFNRIYKANKQYWAKDQLEAAECIHELAESFKPFQTGLEKLVEVQYLCAQNIFSRGGNHLWGPDVESLEPFRRGAEQAALSLEQIYRFFIKSLVSHCHLHFGESLAKNIIHKKQEMGWGSLDEAALSNNRLLKALEITELLVGRYVYNGLSNALVKVDEKYSSSAPKAGNNSNDTRLTELYTSILQVATQECYDSLSKELKELARALTPSDTSGKLKSVFWRVLEDQRPPLREIQKRIGKLNPASTEDFIPKLIKIELLVKNITSDERCGPNNYIETILQIHQAILHSPVWKSTAQFWISCDEDLRVLASELGKKISGIGKTEDKTLIAFTAKALKILDIFTIKVEGNFGSAEEAERDTIKAKENTPVFPKKLYKALDEIRDHAENACHTYKKDDPPPVLADVIEVIQKDKTYNQCRSYELESQAQAAIATFRPKGAR